MQVASNMVSKDKQSSIRSEGYTGIKGNSKTDDHAPSGPSIQTDRSGDGETRSLAASNDETSYLDQSSIW
jgi:hypothetical protein